MAHRIAWSKAKPGETTEHALRRQLMLRIFRKVRKILHGPYILRVDWVVPYQFYYGPKAFWPGNYSDKPCLVSLGQYSLILKAHNHPVEGFPLADPAFMTRFLHRVKATKPPVSEEEGNKNERPSP